MISSNFRFVSASLFAATILIHFSSVIPAIGGNAFPPDGLQIRFADNGAGGTSITISGGGSTNNDGVGNAGLGFDQLDGADTLDTSNPPALAALADIEPVTLSDTFTLEWLTLGTFEYNQLDIDPDGGSSQGLIFLTEDGMPDMTTVTNVEATDATGTIPLPYSTFAAVHGQSFPSDDGFTFVFEASPTSHASACADKSQLLRKIKKLKKKLKNAKQAGNVTTAKKLKKKLKKLKKLYKTLC